MTKFNLDEVRAPVTLRCSTFVDGREIAVVQQVGREHWDAADERMRDQLKGILRNDLSRQVTSTGSTPDRETIEREAIRIEVPTDLQDQLYRGTVGDVEL